MSLNPIQVCIKNAQALLYLELRTTNALKSCFLELFASHWRSPLFQLRSALHQLSSQQISLDRKKTPVDIYFGENYILVTIFLKHDQSKNLDRIQAELRETGFYQNFPPEGVEIEDWKVVMGIGQVVTLRLPPERLRLVNRAIEAMAWRSFRTEFYPTYNRPPNFGNSRNTNTSARSATNTEDDLLLTVFLRHDQSKTIEQIRTELQSTGFRENFPPEGTEIITRRIVMGIGQVLTLRVPPSRLRSVNVAIALRCLGCFSQRFLPYL